MEKWLRSCSLMAFACKIISKFRSYFIFFPSGTCQYHYDLVYNSFHFHTFSFPFVSLFSFYACCLCSFTPSKRRRDILYGDSFYAIEHYIYTFNTCTRGYGDQEVMFIYFYLSSVTGLLYRPIVLMLWNYQRYIFQISPAPPPPPPPPKKKKKKKKEKKEYLYLNSL